MTKWSENEISILITMFNDGTDYKTISRTINRTPNSIRLKLSNLGLKKNSSKHKYEIGETVNDSLIIVKKTINEKNNNKAYVVQSVTYPDAPTYIVDEYELNDNHKDLYTVKNRYKKVFEGNSIYSIEHIRPYLVDVEKAKTISPQSRKTIKLKCSHCGTSKEMKANTLICYGFNCACSIHLSYPELLFRSVNIQQNLGFVTEQTFDDFVNYRFDFVDYKNRIIVETHGEQHYKSSKNNIWKNIHERSVKSDKAKRKYCKDNGWTLIELDCRKSNFKFITDNINKCDLLPNISKDDEIEILKIMEINKRHK